MGNLISIVKYNNKDMCFIKKQKNKVKETRTRPIQTPEFITSPHLPIPMNL
jgi:hypothetical protein